MPTCGAASRYPVLGLSFEPLRMVIDVCATLVLHIRLKESSQKQRSPTHSYHKD